MRSLFSIFRALTPRDVATKELKEARLICLAALTHREHADSIVAFRTTQMQRLEQFLKTQN